MQLPDVYVNQANVALAKQGYEQALALYERASAAHDRKNAQVRAGVAGVGVGVGFGVCGGGLVFGGRVGGNHVSRVGLGCGGWCWGPCIVRESVSAQHAAHPAVREPITLSDDHDLL